MWCEDEALYWDMPCFSISPAALATAVENYVPTVIKLNEICAIIEVRNYEIG